MKSLFFIFCFSITILALCAAKSTTAKTLVANAIAADTANPPSYFVDVHNLEPGKVTFEDVMKAHQKDLATEGKYNVNFLKFWLDAKQGIVYCLSKANDSTSVKETHEEAHGLMPSKIYSVVSGQEAPRNSNKSFFIDVHEMGAGNVTAADVAAAHTKDLQVQDKYGVNFINYWVDEKKGIIMCLSQAADSNAVKKAHQEAHGLLPAYMLQVQQGE